MKIKSAVLKVSFTLFFDRNLLDTVINMIFNEKIATLNSLKKLIIH